jgi:hypothetical protein
MVMRELADLPRILEPWATESQTVATRATIWPRMMRA